MKGDVVRLGVVGPRDLVDRIGSQAPMRFADTPRFQLIPGVYRHEDEAIDRVMDLADRVDGYLFTGPLPYRLVQGKMPDGKSATFVPLGGASLFAAFASAAISGLGDLEKVSIDTVSLSEVLEAWEHLEIGSDWEPQVADRALDEDAEGLVDFHSGARSEGLTTLTVTGVLSVYERLMKAGHPVVRMTPTAASIRAALRTAVLLTEGGMKRDPRVTACIASIADSQAWDNVVGARGSAWLAALEYLREKAEDVGGVCLPLSGSSAVVFCTGRPFDEGWTGGRELAGELAALVGTECDVGCHSASSVAHAYQGAVAKLSSAHDPVSGAADVNYREGAEGGPRVDAQTLRTYRALVAACNRGERVPYPNKGVLSADGAGQILDLSERQARRSLDSLVEAGLAWPLPPSREGQPGRPRRRWRLHLESEADASGVRDTAIED